MSETTQKSGEAEKPSGAAIHPHHLSESGVEEPGTEECASGVLKNCARGGGLWEAYPRQKGHPEEPEK